MLDCFIRVRGLLGGSIRARGVYQGEGALGGSIRVRGLLSGQGAVGWVYQGEGLLGIAIGAGGYFARSGDIVLVKDSILEWCGQVGAYVCTYN